MRTRRRSAPRSSWRAAARRCRRRARRSRPSATSRPTRRSEHIRTSIIGRTVRRRLRACGGGRAVSLAVRDRGSPPGSPVPRPSRATKRCGAHPNEEGGGGGGTVPPVSRARRSGGGGGEGRQWHGAAQAILPVSFRSLGERARCDSIAVSRSSRRTRWHSRVSSTVKEGATLPHIVSS